jgi:ubiquinone/menaquinone biosynthesis C-methylase UbiE
MSTIVERYDRDSEDYARYWAPVLDRSARQLLDQVESYVARLPAARVLDVGTGSGVLTLDALRRWPHVSVIASDASSGMLGVARRHAAAAGIDPNNGRVSWLHSPAESLALPDRSVDLVVSSFVYQLVPDRHAALREAWRVLRPGGRLALVTWRDTGDDFEPALEFNEAVYDLGIEEPEMPPEEPVAGDLRSPRTTADELRRAGFRRVSARAETLEYAWTLDSYLEYKERYDEVGLMSWLDRRTAQRLMDRARERLAALPPEAFIWRADLVSATGERPR